MKLNVTKKFLEQELYTLEEILRRHMGHTVVITLPKNEDTGYALWCSTCDERIYDKSVGSIR